MKHLMLFLMFMTVLVGSSAKADACKGCDELKTLEMEMRSGKVTREAFTNKVGAQASELINKVAGSNDATLSPGQALRIVRIISASLNLDQENSLVVKHFDLLKKNEKTVRKQALKLDRTERKFFLEALDNAIRERKVGNG